MKTNKKSTEEQRTEIRERKAAVKVTALAIIPKPMKLLTSQNMPTATEVTETPEAATAVPEMATVPTVTEEAPQQAVFKTPLATATAETDLDITTVPKRRQPPQDVPKTHHCRNSRKAFGKWESCRPLRYAHARKAVMKSYTVNAVTVPSLLAGAKTM